eukprot:gnl/Chilomastix_cuspidata/526.p1 GENE.gnl/Chilomastix_cuspidata/526~~gnl/Chilomastix_cuspidata/526.p1  ORF type:complete len:567 (-),score=202.00 gnl/Chilomastix_cuspidata/526:405-2105(-)
MSCGARCGASSGSSPSSPRKSRSPAGTRSPGASSSAGPSPGAPPSSTPTWAPRAPRRRPKSAARYLQIDPQDLVQSKISTWNFRSCCFLMRLASLALLLAMAALAAASDSFYETYYYNTGDQVYVDVNYVTNYSVVISPESSYLDTYVTFNTMQFQTYDDASHVYVMVDACDQTLLPSDYLDADLVFSGREYADAGYPADVWSLFVPAGNCIYMAFVCSKAYTSDGFGFFTSETDAECPDDACTMRYIDSIVGTFADEADSDFSYMNNFFRFDVEGTLHLTSSELRLDLSCDLLQISAGECTVNLDAVDYAYDNINYTSFDLSALAVTADDPCASFRVQMGSDYDGSEYNFSYYFEPTAVPSETEHSSEAFDLLMFEAGAPHKLRDHIAQFDQHGQLRVLVESGGENSNILLIYPNVCQSSDAADGVPAYVLDGTAHNIGEVLEYDLDHNTPCVLFRFFASGSAPVGTFSVTYDFDSGVIATSDTTWVIWLVVVAVLVVAVAALAVMLVRARKGRSLCPCGRARSYNSAVGGNNFNDSTQLTASDEDRAALATENPYQLSFPPSRE